MAFLKNLFIVSLVVAVTSYQLNAMESKAMTAMLEKPVASDFQIYQLLSAVTKDNNPEAYLPDDVTKIIMTHVREITKELCKECYQKYGECLDSPRAVLDLFKTTSLADL